MSTSKPSAPTTIARKALSWALVSGLLSAGLAAWLLQRYEHEVSGGEPVQVLRALRPIARGSLLTDELLSTATVPASYVDARAVRASDLAKIRGVRVASALEPQDTLQWSDLAVSQERRDLSALVQPGSRAVTIHASAVSSAEGSHLIRPGDYVDVLANLGMGETVSDRSGKLVSVVLLQRVLVLAVGVVTDPQLLRNDTVSEALANRNGAALTLSLKVEEAQLIALAQARGQLSVMLRQPDDTRIIDAAPEMPVSSLFDGAFRNALQRQRNVDRRPVRLTSSAGSP